MKLIKGVFLAGILTSACVVSAGAAWLGVGTTTGDGVRLRAEANTSSATLTTVAEGQNVAVTGGVKGWYQVEYDGQAGYMSADYMVMVDNYEGELGYCAVDTEGDNLNIRAGAGTQFDILGSIPDGTVVAIEGVTDGWLKVTYKGVTGYISTDYVKHAKEAASEETANGQVASAAPSALAGSILNVAYAQQGKPYVWGGAGPNGFDCSGFTSYVARQCGYSIPRTATQQFKGNPGTFISSMGALQAGDFVYICNPAYAAGHPISHTMIYVGNNQIIHADSTTRRITVKSFEGYKKYFKGAWRLG